MNRLPLSAVLGRGIVPTPFEAVAIALELLSAGAADAAAAPPFGPPALDTVLLGADGAVVCRTCAATPASSEIGILLDAILPHGAGGTIPGGLRYTIARALLEVDAPPFDSVHDLAAALARFEGGDRRTVLRDLYARATASSAEPVTAAARVPPPRDRRRPSASVDELRRQLRAADERLYLMTIAAAQPETTHAHAAAATVLPPAEAPARTADATPAAAEVAWLRAVDPPVVSAFDPVILRAEPIVAPDPPRRFRPMRWLAAGSVAAAAAFAAGYAAVDRMWMQRLPITIATVAAVPPAADGPVTSALQHRDAVELRHGGDAADRVVRAVSRSSGPSFSPSFASNGTAIFFHTGRTSDARSALESADLVGGSTGASDLRVMTIVDDGAKNFHVQPSPDGTRVAFDSDRDGERGVYVADRDGTHVRRVSGPGYAALPAWSPDGTRLALVRGEPDRPRVWNLWLLNLASGAFQRLTAYRYGQTWTASWFTDGRRVAYTHEDRLVIRNLADGSSREFPSPVAHRLVRTAAVSPDGRHVVFQVTGSGAWLLDLTDGSMRCVLSDSSAEEFAWSPDGRRVAFHSRRDGQWGIWLLAPAE